MRKLAGLIIGAAGYYLLAHDWKILVGVALVDLGSFVCEGREVHK